MVDNLDILPNWKLIDEISIPLLETGVGTLPILQAALPSVLAIDLQDEKISERYRKIIRISQLQIQHLLKSQQELLKHLEKLENEIEESKKVAKIDQFGKFKSNLDNLTVFSAYSNPDKITVILASRGYLNRRVYCRLFNKEKIEIYQETSVVFPEFTVNCNPDFHGQAKFVGISINSKDPIKKLTKLIEYSDPKPIFDFTICLAPIFGSSPKIFLLAEFLEFYKVQKADHFIVYLFEFSENVENFLKTYEKENVEIVKISSNSSKCVNRHRCRHEMQLQDCIYRSRKISRFVGTVDLDERIWATKQDRNIFDFLESSQSVAEYRFQCQWTLRYSEIPYDPKNNQNHNLHEILPILKWHNTSHVAPQNHTSKSIVRPEFVDSMGVHGVQKYSLKIENPLMLVDPDEFVVRHYRLVDGWNYFLNETESFGNFTIFYPNPTFIKTLIERVKYALNRFFAYQNSHKNLGIFRFIDFAKTLYEIKMSTSEQKATDKCVQLRKKSAKELEEMATARSKGGTMSAESVDEPVALVSCPSETSMQKLNNDLKKVKIVKDFNSAETHLENPDKKGEK
ncbi:unnamed protein product [Caenorhabditis angaria]|uniref:Glycosyltransferase family 92 protein n=1 Tax=Caenorhabditis angaria TaxID=860376 RepID=A0A9P1N424_9PELO|nr:unnamed protein product [Caenorhabditis angaria]